MSRKYAISPDTLRYYKRIGLIPPVNRIVCGIRDYDEIDLKRVEFIKCMRSAGLPVEVLIDYVSLFQQGDGTIKARKEILQEQRAILAAKIAELQATMDLVDYKIAKYEKTVLKAEQELAQIQEL